MFRVLLYRIARECGIPDVDKMARSLSCKQVMEWMEFFALEAEEIKKLQRQSDPNADTSWR